MQRHFIHVCVAFDILCATNLCYGQTELSGYGTAIFLANVNMIWNVICDIMVLC